MDPPLNFTHDRILADNAALRQWADALRAWARAAREMSAAERARTRRLRPTDAAGTAGRAGGVGLPPLDPVAVGELVDVLVDGHGFTADEAARAIAIGKLAYGYPEDCDRVSAADAFDLVLETLEGRW
jgi:hypothetical protein